MSFGLGNVVAKHRPYIATQHWSIQRIIDDYTNVDTNQLYDPVCIFVEDNIDKVQEEINSLEEAYLVEYNNDESDKAPNIQIVIVIIPKVS